jgi:hypothetical protein
VEKLAKDKYSSLLGKFVNYGHKKFYNIGPWMLGRPWAPLCLDRVKESSSKNTKFKIVSHFIAYQGAYSQCFIFFIT